MSPSTAPTRWRQAILAGMVRHNDTMRALIGHSWRPPGWVRYGGETVPKPEATPEVLFRTARILRGEARRLGALATDCEARAADLEREAAPS